MNNIAKKLHENRQIQLAKEILESNGYKVSKKSLRESSNSSIIDDLLDSIEGADFTLAQYNEEQGHDEDVMEESDTICSLLGETPESVVIAEYVGDSKTLVEFLKSQRVIKSAPDTQKGSFTLYNVKGVGKVVVGYNTGEITIMAPMPGHNRDGQVSGKYGDVEY